MAIILVSLVVICVVYRSICIEWPDLHNCDHDPILLRGSELRLHHVLQVHHRDHVVQWTSRFGGPPSLALSG